MDTDAHGKTRFHVSCPACLFERPIYVFETCQYVFVREPPWPPSNRIRNEPCRWPPRRAVRPRASPPACGKSCRASTPTARYTIPGRWTTRSPNAQGAIPATIRRLTLARTTRLTLTGVVCGLRRYRRYHAPFHLPLRLGHGLQADDPRVCRRGPHSQTAYL